MSIIFRESWKATELKITRKYGNEISLVLLSLSDGEDTRKFQFVGSRDIEELLSVFSAWHIEISEDSESQKEFGRVTLALTCDGYVEIFFDSFSEIKDAIT